MKRFEGKTVVVIGAGSGMGRAAAERMGQEGGHIRVIDVNEAAAHEVVDAIAAQGGDAMAEVLDATEVEQLRDLYQRVERERGALHAVHYQVGVPGPSGLDVDEATWQQVLDVNLRSAYFASTLAFEHLERTSGGGSLTLTSTAAAIVGSARSPIYSMTKGALLPFARSLAVVGGPRGIRVNAICPGMIETPMLPQFFGDGTSTNDAMAGFKAAIPLGRAARAEEVGAVIAFLNSDDASYITGVTLPVDGGLTIS